MFLSSCASTGRIEERVRADFHVLAPSADLEGEVAQLMCGLLPQISAAFGDPVGGTVFVAVSPDCQSERAKRSAAVSSSSGILVYDTDPGRIAGTLGHEIAHVVLRYRSSFWNTLPIILEEGLCCLVDYGLTGASEIVLEGYVPTSVVEHYLGLRLDDLHAQEGDDLRTTYRIATYLAGILGFDRLEALSRRAYSEGNAVIPTEWILEVREQVERIRHSDRSGPPSSSLDPLFGRIEAPVPRETTVRIQADFPGREFDGAQVEGGFNGVYGLAGDLDETGMKVLAPSLTGALPLAHDRGHGLDHEESILTRPVVIGASISAGFSAGKDLSQVLDAMFEQDGGSIETAFSMLFWRDPIETGRFQAGFALEREPTVLIAIDFLFWFGYAACNLEGDPVTSGAERLELLKYGLGLLEPFSCPIVLGDIPHYRKDLGHMISPVEMPGPETLQELNRELRGWSEERGNVLLLPLADELEKIQDNEETVIGDYACRKGMTQDLLQPDLVHPTLEGLVWISYLMATEMVTREWIESSDFDQDLSFILGELRDGEPPSPRTVKPWTSTPQLR